MNGNNQDHLNKNIRIMTYNVHGCRGMDKEISSDRIAQVIDQYDPDIVALQELDLGRPRSGGVDQPHAIAHYLDMTHHFHSAIQVEEEQYGNAILSRHPLKLIKAEQLPALAKYQHLERRGVIWASVHINGGDIQLFNTHLGLKKEERHAHVTELLSEQWIDHERCRGPVILCGDFNSWSNSLECKLLNTKLNDVQLLKTDHRPKATWFSHFPFSRIDHIFVSSGIQVTNIEVPKTKLNKSASDHLPLMADIKIMGKEND